jgi:L-asparagine transporter-like permease
MINESEVPFAQKETQDSFWFKGVREFIRTVIIRVYSYVGTDIVQHCSQQSHRKLLD